MRWQGVVVGDLALDGAQRRREADARQELAHVLDLFRKLLRALGIGRIIGQQPVVFLEGSAAAGGVDDDGIQVPLLEGVNVHTGHPTRFFLRAGVGLERATAALRLRDDYLAAIGRQHAHGGLVRFGERQRHDTAADHADAIAPLTLGRDDLPRRGAEEAPR